MEPERAPSVLARRRRAALAVVALVVLVAAAAALVCAPRVREALGLRPRPATYADARAVVERRCVECHSARPTSRAFPFAPKGVMFDTSADMQRWAQRIEVRAVVERTMPLANMTGMTEAERDVLGRWVEHGAPGP